VPLLVAWGPKLADELGDRPRLMGETRVVAGRHSSAWLQKMVGAADRSQIDLPATRTIETLILEEAPDRSDPITGTPWRTGPAPPPT
jgi:hypothetical protein